MSNSLEDFLKESRGATGASKSIFSNLAQSLKKDVSLENQGDTPSDLDEIKIELQDAKSQIHSSLMKNESTLKRIKLAETGIVKQNNIIYLGYIILLVMVATLIVMVLDMYFNKNLLVNQNSVPQTIILQTESK